MNLLTKKSKEVPKTRTIHKDREPKETVSSIKDRLFRLGLSITEPVTFKNPYSNCWSCTVKDCDYPLFGANGKGTSREYALASAYAEYIERLQCYVHVRFGWRSLGRSEEDIHPDFLYLNKHELTERCPSLFRDLCLEDVPSDRFFCLPFAMPFEGKVGPLPYDLMLSGTRSNGMCAGNSPDEAICQGICEIMERYALRMIATGNTPFFPTVSLDSLPIKDTLTFDMINELKSRGMEVIVKDCTFNGRIPVISVIIIDMENDLCNVGFGSDPVFEIALERCVTEIFQNRDKLIFSFSKTIKNDQVEKDLFNNPGRLIKYLLGGPTVNGPDFIKTFAPSGRTNKYYLKYLLNILRMDGKTIYIRDFSFLGFPSYYIFIPKMSIFSPSRDELALGMSDGESIRGILSRLRDDTPEALIRKMADLFSHHLKNNNPFSVEITQLMERVLEGSPVMAWMDPMVFMVFVFIEVKDFRSATEVLGKFEEPFSEFIEIRCILKKYCELKLQRKSRTDILLQLKKEYRGSQYYNSFRHLINGGYSSFYNRVPEDYPMQKFDGLSIPLCADKSGCSSCLCRHYCYIDEFLDIREKILEKYTECDQHNLLLYINQIMTN